MSGECEFRVSRRDVICGSRGSGNPEVGLQGETQTITIEKASLPHDLPEFLHSLDLSDNAPVVVYNTYMTTYLENKGISLRNYLGEWATSQNREIMWIQSEPADGSLVEHHWCAWTVDLWAGEEKHSWQLAWVHPHGTEMDLLEGLDDFEAFFRRYG